MTSLTSSPPCWVDAPREGTNSAEDFVRVIIWLLESGALREGDILFMDNAAIHFAADIRDTLVAMARIHRVELMFLPTYSPKLNPCELVFQWVKAQLRLSKAEGPLWRRAQHYFMMVTQEMMMAWYRHCLAFPHC